MSTTSIAVSPSRTARGMPLFAVLVCALAPGLASAADPFAYLPAHDTGVNTFTAVNLASRAASAAVTVDIGGTTTGTSTVFFGVAYSAVTGMLFIGDDGHTESVFQVDTRHNNAIVKQYFVDANLRGMTVDPTGRYVYVAEFGSQGVAIIDTTKSGAQAVSDVSFDQLDGLPAKPYDVKLNLAGTVGYVTDSSVNQRVCRFTAVPPQVSVSDADCVAVGTDPTNGAANPNALAVSPDGTRVYVVNHNDNSISVVDTTRLDAVTHKPILVVLRSFKLGHASPNGIAIQASGKRGYVGTGFGELLSLDLKAAEDTTTSPNPVVNVISNMAMHSLQGLSMSPDGKQLLAADNDNALHFINLVNNADTYDSGTAVTGRPVSYGEFTARDPIFVGGFQN